MSRAATRYQQNDVFSMSPARRVVFLYGHILASLRQAARAIERGEVEPRNRQLTRAREILAELLCTLDFEHGGSIAANLAALYTWLVDEIAAVDRQADRARLERLTTLVAELHGAWDKAAELAPDFARPSAVGE